MREIVRSFGLPESIVSDRDSKFTSMFWQEVHRLMGTRLLMSTSFHPQTDGASERMIRLVTQILRSVVKPDQTDWAERLPMTEFACNAHKSASSGMAPFEIVYGKIPRMGFQIPKSAYPGVQEFANNVAMNLATAHDALIESRVEQTHYANQRRRDDEKYKEGDLVYVSTENMNLPKGRVRKLLPKYIGPYKVLRARTETSHYAVDLPSELTARRIHSTFHVSKLRPHVENNRVTFPGREAQFFYDFGEPEDQEWQVEGILAHKWEGNKIQFQVQWTMGKCTWEPYDSCKELQALDEYLKLRGVTNWRSLKRKA